MPWAGNEYKEYDTHFYTSASHFAKFIVKYFFRNAESMAGYSMYNILRILYELDK